MGKMKERIIDEQFIIDEKRRHVKDLLALIIKISDRYCEYTNINKIDHLSYILSDVVPLSNSLRALHALSAKYKYELDLKEGKNDRDKRIHCPRG